MNFTRFTQSDACTTTSDFAPSSVTDPVIIVNAKLGLLREEVANDLVMIEKWLNDILTQTPHRAIKKQKRCEICGSKEDAADLEQHHIAGEKHDFRTITLCEEGCHKELSRRQYLWDHRWFHGNQPDNVRNAFLLMGIREILLLKGEVTRNSNYRLFADKLVWDISQLLMRSNSP